jgi:type I restriction enzyme S subunit
MTLPPAMRRAGVTALPSGWRVVPLGELVDPVRPISYGVVKPGEDGPNGVKFIRGGDVQHGRISSRLRTIPESVSKQYRRTLLRGGELVVALVGFPGQSAIVPMALAGANLARQVGLVAIPDQDMCRYVHQFIQSDVGQAIMLHPLAGSAQQVINLADLKKFPVALPPDGLRDAIAKTGQLLDRYTHRLTRLLRAKRRMRDGIAAELLTGRRRLPGLARRPWREVRLGEVTRESMGRNGERLGADRVMAVTKSIGLTPMRVHTMSDSLARYKVLRPGAFAYNPMRLNIGSIARSSFKRDVLVSPDYVVFEALPESLDPRFLDYTRRAHAWRRFMMAAGSGGVRIRIYYDDLARLRLPLPGREEQSAIADILDTAFQEVACLTLLRETVTKQKRGLMQRLLTGNIGIEEDCRG